MVVTRGRKAIDQRMISRLEACLDCQFDFEGVHYDALVIDLSLKGAFLSSGFQPPIGSSITVTIQSSPLGRPLVLEGKVKRSSRDLWDHGCGGRFGIEVNRPPLDLAKLVTKLIPQRDSN